MVLNAFFFVTIRDLQISGVVDVPSLANDQKLQLSLMVQ
jgi:hypothetical protein